MSYKGPLRLNKAARRLGETKAFAIKRKKSKIRAKLARAARKRK